MKKTNIYFTDRQYEELKRISNRDDISFAELVRRAVDEYLAKLRRGLNHARER